MPYIVEANSWDLVVPNYARPPIIEAVIEIRLVDVVPQSAIEKAKKQLAKGFNRSEELKEVSLHFQALSESASIESSFGGVKLYSETGADIVWLKPNGLIVSRLPPYCGWDEFRALAVDAFNSWRKAVGTKPIARIGVRYINRIDIPVTAETKLRIEDYLELTPHYPDPDQVFLSYTMQTQLPLEDNFYVNVNTGTAPPALINHYSCLLDLDVARELNLPQSDDEIWSMIDAMRAKKNAVFESYITDKTRTLFV